MDFPVMRRASRWNGYLFCALLVGMTIYALPKSLAHLGSRGETLSLYLRGGFAREFETAFDRGVPFREAAIHFWGNMHYLLFREGQPGVIIGRDDWLFSNEELLIPARFDLVMDDHLADIAAIRDRLQAQGKRLIMIPVPMKATLYRDKLDDRINPRLVQLERDFPAALAAKGIEHQPLFDVFQHGKAESQLFLSRDTHWTPEGARLAAKTVAEQFPELKSSTQYQAVIGNPVRYEGDLTRFIRTSEWFAAGIRAPEQLTHYEVAPVLEEISEKALFGPSQTPLLLIGSSYSNIDAWNFTGFLQQAFSREVVSLSVSAKGPYYAMNQFLDSPPDWADDVDVVLWEFPVRTLLTQERRIAAWQASLQKITDISAGAIP